MCGIAGIIELKGAPVYKQQLGNMLEAIKHRGPDDEGIFIDGAVGLGHVRLSIIDLSKAGHQPMFSNNNRYCIVFNGEIYNYIELREELKSHYQFVSKTDTEVLLAAYIVWGEACLHKLNGDFAFVIYDTQDKTIFGARDRFGIKPFYYSQSTEKFIFASEINAVIKEEPDRKVNEKVVFDYLVYNRTDTSHETFFQSVYKLKHGHCFTIKGGVVDIKRWYNLNERIQYPTPISKEAYREELKKAIGLRLRSDVPVGVCLSGGIDSSTLASVLYHDFSVKELKTFSAVFGKGNWADESPFIDVYRGTLKNMYTIQPDAEMFFNEFETFINSHGEPIPGVSPYCQYKVMQLAQGNVGVTLDGQGADEMLGGYTNFYGSYFKELLNGFKWLSLLKEASGYLKKNPSKDAYFYFVFYLLPDSMKGYLGKRKYGSVNKAFYQQHSGISTISEDLYSPETLHDSFLEHFEYKLEHLLKWDDLNSMHFSVESRVPFLDHNFVEKTLSLPPDHILKSGITKYILRESVKDILPAKIYNRYDKKGFSTPSDDWFRSAKFQQFITELLNSDSFNKRGYFDVEDCKRKYQVHLSGKGNLSKDIWKWINLEIWMRNFIDVKKPVQYSYS